MTKKGEVSVTLNAFGGKAFVAKANKNNSSYFNKEYSATYSLFIEIPFGCASFAEDLKDDVGGNKLEIKARE